MSRSRFALIGLAAVALIAALLCWQLLAPGGEGAGDAARLAGAGNAETAALPDAASALAGEAPDALAAGGDGVGSESEAERAARAANYPRRSVSGYVVMADGSAPPRELVLSVALSRQGPQVSTFRDSMNEIGDGGPDGETPSADAATPVAATPAPVAAPIPADKPAGFPDRKHLADLTRTHIQPDGHFTLENVPQVRAWIVVEDD